MTYAPLPLQLSRSLTWFSALRIATAATSDKARMTPRPGAPRDRRAMQSLVFSPHDARRRDQNVQCHNPVLLTAKKPLTFQRFHVRVYVRIPNASPPKRCARSILMRSILAGKGVPDRRPQVSKRASILLNIIFNLNVLACMTGISSITLDR